MSLAEGSNKTDRAFSCYSSLNGKDEEDHHGQPGMLDLCKLKSGFFFRVLGQTQRIEELASWVQPFLWVKFCISLKLYVSYHYHLDPYQCGQ